MTDTDTSVLERTETTTAPRLSEPGDHEKFAHYAHKADIERAIFSGIPLVALCGKKWLPSRDPKGFPVCPTCKDFYDQMQPGDPDNPDYAP